MQAGSPARAAAVRRQRTPPVPRAVRLLRRATLRAAPDGLSLVFPRAVCAGEGGGGGGAPICAYIYM